MTARRIRRALALLAVVTGTLSGCSSSVSFPAEFAGVYNLTTANDHALPYTLPNTPAGITAVLTSGSLVLLDNGRFSEVLRYTFYSPDNANGSPTQAETIGDVEISGGTITFKPRFEASWSGTATTTDISYTKQGSTVSLALHFVRAGP
jgi:hypothetical protein